MNDIFEYKDGKLYWKIEPHYRSRQKIGDEAGDFDGKYWRVRFGNFRKRRHRVIYYLHTGKWPPLIDHIDRNKTNDRIENLREFSPSENSHNSVFCRGKVPYRGVHLHTDGRFRAQFVNQGKKIELGLFATAEEASDVYEKCKQIHTSHSL